MIRLRALAILFAFLPLNASFASQLESKSPFAAPARKAPPVPFAAALVISGAVRLQNNTSFTFSGEVEQNPSKTWFNSPFYETAPGQTVKLTDAAGSSQLRRAYAVQGSDGNLSVTIEGNPSIQLNATGRHGRLTGRAIETVSGAAEAYDYDGSFVMMVK